MKTFWIAVFALLAGSLVWLSITSSLVANVMVGFDEVLATSWGVATIVDLYIGFFIMVVIAFISEPNKVMKFIWIPLIFCLGNFSVLIFLIRILVISPQQNWKTLLSLGERR